MVGSRVKSVITSVTSLSKEVTKVLSKNPIFWLDVFGDLL